MYVLLGMPIWAILFADVLRTVIRLIEIPFSKTLEITLRDFLIVLYDRG